MTTIAKTDTKFHKIVQSPEANSRLLDVVIIHLKLKNDAALSRLMKVAPPVISKIRNNRLPVGPSFLLQLHEVSRIKITSLKWIMEHGGTLWRENRFQVEVDA